MKKLISLLSILFLLTLFVAPKQVAADRGSGGSHESGGHEGFRGHGGFLPGLIIGGAIGWSLWPYYYPPDYYYYPPPPNYYYPPTAQSSQVPPSASQGSGGKMFIYPRQGQSEEKKAEDFDK